MFDFLSTSQQVSTGIGLIAFAGSILFLTFRRHQSIKEKQYRAIKNDKDRIKYLTSWLNIPVENLNSNQVFALAEITIKTKHRNNRNLMIFSSVLFLFALIFVVTHSLFNNNNGGSGKKLSCASRFNMADSSITKQYYGKAITSFKSYIADCGDPEGLATARIGTAYYYLARYDLALDWHKRASEFMKRNKKVRKAYIGRVLVSIGYDYEGLKFYGKALEYHSKSIIYFELNSYDYRDAVFSQGRINMILWADKEYPRNEKHHAAALTKFEKFLNIGGRPRHWVSYNRFCLNLAKSSTKKDYVAKAKELTALVDEFGKLDSITRGPRHRAYFRKLILHHKFWTRKPTLPIRCPAIGKMLKYCMCKDHLEKVISDKFAN